MTETAHSGPSCEPGYICGVSDEIVLALSRAFVHGLKWSE